MIFTNYTSPNYLAFDLQKFKTLYLVIEATKFCNLVQK